MSQWTHMHKHKYGGDENRWSWSYEETSQCGGTHLYAWRLSWRMFGRTFWLSAKTRRR